MPEFNKRQSKNRSSQGGPRRRRREKSSPILQEFDQKVLDIARVARVTSGGRRFSFRVVMVIGDRNGRVGVGVDQGKDVAFAMEKAATAARRNLVTVVITKEGTIPFDVSAKYTSAVVLLRPARKGRGIIAGGAMRAVCDLAGFTDITGKMIGRSNNKLNNAMATIIALQKLSGVYVRPVTKALNAAEASSAPSELSKTPSALVVSEVEPVEGPGKKKRRTS